MQSRRCAFLCILGLETQSKGVGYVSFPCPTLITWSLDYFSVGGEFAVAGRTLSWATRPEGGATARLCRELSEWRLLHCCLPGSCSTQEQWPSTSGGEWTLHFVG